VIINHNNKSKIPVEVMEEADGIWMKGAWVKGEVTL